MFSEFSRDNECKGACGKGTKEVSWFEDCYEDVNTLELYCNEKSLKSEYEVCDLEPCPKEATYGEWSEWTKCSCFEKNGQIKTQKRHRTCENCNEIGKNETRNCLVVMCEPECPR